MGIFFFSHTLELYLNKTKDSQIQIFNQNQGFYLICKLVVQNDFFPREAYKLAISLL